MKKCILIILSIATINACTLGPRYVQPEPCVTNEWQHSDFTTPEDPYPEWWQFFNDPLLDKYIQLAYFYNNELLAADARIIQARALRQVVASNLFPKVTADFNASRTYFSKNGPLFAADTFSQGVSPVSGLPFSVQIPQVQNLFNALIDVTWEIDIFGKRRKQVEIADAVTGIAIEDRNGRLLSLFAEVARTYMEIRGSQSRGILIEETLSLLEQTAEVARLQFQKGYRNRLDLDRIEAEMLNQRAQLPNIYAQIIRDIYALSVLTGYLPETLMCELMPFQPLPKTPPMVAMGLRSDLLRRRPDVRAAEREMAAATAAVGFAVASFFPTFTLSADVGFQSLKLSNLFSGKSKTWSLQGDARMPLFQGGSLMGTLKLSEGAMVGAAYNYKQKVLNAIEEAEGNLIAYVQDSKTSLAYEEAVNKNREIVQLMRQRYAMGIVNVLDLLDSQRQLIQSELSLLSSQTSTLTDLILLYKSLGGGWEVACPR